MSEEMNNEVMEAVKKHLPGKVCEEVKKAIEENAKLKDSNIGYIEKNGKLEDEVCKLQEELSKHASLDEREKELDERQDKVAERERLRDVGQLMYQLQAEKEKSAFAMEVCQTLVKNTEYKKSVFGSKDTAVPNDHYSMNKSYNHDETVTAE